MSRGLQINMWKRLHLLTCYLHPDLDCHLLHLAKVY